MNSDSLRSARRRFSLGGLAGLTLSLTLSTSVAEEMADTIYNLWCYVQGDNTYFPVIASSAISIGVLQKMIKEDGKNGVLNSVDAKDLTLWKVCYITVSM